VRRCRRFGLPTKASALLLLPKVIDAVNIKFKFTKSVRRPQEEARSALEKKAAMIHLAGPIPGRFGFSVALNITIGSETGARRVSLLLLSGEKLVSIVTSREGG
jgi:hypothetical protein